MTFDEWVEKFAVETTDADYTELELSRAWDAGFKEACRRYNLREDPEEYQVSQGFDEYPYYGENNPPVGELK